jgi:hypothetical protein
MWLDDDLPPEIVPRLEALCREAESLAEESPDLGIAKFDEAFELLPEPREQWLSATWILIAIGDIQYLWGRLSEARETFASLVHFEGWHDNQFVHLRRGQIAYDFGNFEIAANELALAFMAGGYEILETADEKYAEFILSKLRSPEPPIDHPLARFHPATSVSRWKFW